MDQLGFQEVDMCRGFALTKHEHVASYRDSVYNSFDHRGVLYRPKSSKQVRVFLHSGVRSSITIWKKVSPHSERQLMFALLLLNIQQPPVSHPLFTVIRNI